MSRISDPMSLQAEISDLSRRINQLESLYLGKDSQPQQSSSLITLYWDACRCRVFDDTMARHWERQVYGLDARSLLAMARLVRDPTPWHPFMILIDSFIEVGFDLDEPQAHLLHAAQDLLRIQGLGKLNPRDFAGNPLRIRTALSTISQMYSGPRSSRVRLYTKKVGI